ncbi:MAG: hypothetical protein JWR03_1232 [Cohnella sp.]|nr:hypothetical protein [Cohnella sp.]
MNERHERVIIHLDAVFKPMIVYCCVAYSPLYFYIQTFQHTLDGHSAFHIRWQEQSCGKTQAAWAKIQQNHFSRSGLNHTSAYSDESKFCENAFVKCKADMSAAACPP